MSNLSRHRNKVIAGAVIAAAGSAAHAAPLVNVQMLGWDINQQGPAPAVIPATYNGTVHNLGSNVTVAVGDTVVYEILTFLSPIGTHNSNTDATHPTGFTINTKYTGSGVARNPIDGSQVNAGDGAGYDGINSLTFDAYQVASDGVQVILKKGTLASTVHYASTSTSGVNTGIQSNWNNTSNGASAGTVGHEANANVLPGAQGTIGTNGGARTTPNNDLLKIRPVNVPGEGWGVTSTVPEAVLGTGLFVVSATGAQSTVKMRYTPNTGEGGTGGGFFINSNPDGTGASGINLSDASEQGLDPFVGYTGLTLTPLPEPGSLSLLGLAAAGLLARRKNKKA